MRDEIVITPEDLDAVEALLRISRYRKVQTIASHLGFDPWRQEGVCRAVGEALSQDGRFRFVGQEGGSLAPTSGR